MKRFLLLLLCIIIIIGGLVYLLFIRGCSPKIEKTTSIVASDTNTVKVYSREEDLLYEYTQIPRGSRVTNRNVEVDVNDGKYIFMEVELEGDVDEKGNPIVYYMPVDNLTDDQNDIVREDKRFVRTPAVVYKSTDSPEIADFVKKGTELSVTGYYGLKNDGSVEMYKIDNQGSEGYIYAKYLTETKEEAEAVNYEVYLEHAGREFAYELYGGTTDNLDWYPVEKPELSQGPVLQEARAMYINAEAASAGRIDEYIELAKSSGANSVVVDIKDGALTYQSNVAKEQAPSSYSYGYMSMEEFGQAMQKLKDAGFYTIGRIVAFNDSIYSWDHPEDCILYKGEESWPSAYSRNCWYYNVCLALEAVEEYGFNEIQFDYVRFPEASYGMSDSGEADFKNYYNEDKAEAIQNFCFYACDMIHRAGAYVSVDVFGESVEQYVTAYGQYWPAISNVVDAISGMPYTDHFDTSDPDYWEDPYGTVYYWAAKAAARQAEIDTPALARTWITGYNTPNWDPYVKYNDAELITQVEALYDAGLHGGFIPWNGVSNINKYYEYSGVWADRYQKYY